MIIPKIWKNSVPNHQPVMENAILMKGFSGKIVELNKGDFHDFPLPCLITGDGFDPRPAARRLWHGRSDLARPRSFDKMVDLLTNECW
jgi:hypothetical protein